MINYEGLDRSQQALVRSISKNGDFFIAQSELDHLRETLTGQDVVVLYEIIRDHSLRLESEWRAEFISAFPEQEHLLPAPRS